MLGKAVAIVAATTACLSALPGRAQDREAANEHTAEDLIEVAREAWRPPGLRRRCPAPTPSEIVVCAPDPDAFRVESPTDEAIRHGERPSGRQPNAAQLFDPPPCVPSLLTFCGKFGRAAPHPVLVDLTRLPEPLPPEEAALVFRAEEATGDALLEETATAAQAP